MEPERREAAQQLHGLIDQIQKRIGEPQVRARQLQAFQEFRQAESRLEKSTGQAEAALRGATRHADATLQASVDALGVARTHLRELGLDHLLAEPSVAPAVDREADAFQELERHAGNTQRTAHEIEIMAHAIRTVEVTGEAARSAETAFSRLGYEAGRRESRAIREEVRSLDRLSPSSAEDISQIEAKVRSVGAHVEQLLRQLIRRDPGPVPGAARVWPTVLMALGVALLVGACTLGAAVVGDEQRSEREVGFLGWTAIGNGIAGGVVLAGAALLRQTDLVVRRQRHRRRVTARDQAIRSLESALGAQPGKPMQGTRVRLRAEMAEGEQQEFCIQLGGRRAGQDTSGPSDAQDPG